MKNNTEIFGDVYYPQKALLIYTSQQKTAEVYIEAYDIGKNGKPLNAHPLSYQETVALAEQLSECTQLKQDYLIPSGLLPEQVLYINPRSDGYCLWYTKPQNADLLFVKGLDIPCGKANVPALVWKADKRKLSVYAIKTQAKPSLNTVLYKAPFFNIYQHGEVCMGTADMDFADTSCMEDFISRWQQYFFNSYFSHLIGEASPVATNIIQLWKELINTEKSFPADVLIKNGTTIKDLIV